MESAEGGEVMSYVETMVALRETQLDRLSSRFLDQSEWIIKTVSDLSTDMNLNDYDLEDEFASRYGVVQRGQYCPTYRRVLKRMYELEWLDRHIVGAIMGAEGRGKLEPSWEYVYSLCVSADQILSEINQ